MPGTEASAAPQADQSGRAEASGCPSAASLWFAEHRLDHHEVAEFDVLLNEDHPLGGRHLALVLHRERLARQDGECREHLDLSNAAFAYVPNHDVGDFLDHRLHGVAWPLYAHLRISDTIMASPTQNTSHRTMMPRKCQ